MLKIFEERLPKEVKVIQSKKRGDWYKLTLEYSGIQAPIDLRAICPAKKENDVCDFAISTAMMKFALKLNDIELYNRWSEFQNNINVNDAPPKRKTTKICYVTKMKDMPKSCAECMLGSKLSDCWLPLKRNHDGITDECEEAYTTKRHKDCPLVVIEV